MACHNSGKAIEDKHVNTNLYIFHWVTSYFITKTRLFNIMDFFYSCKNGKFLMEKKKKMFFLISTQNIEYGYSLEAPHRGGFNEYIKSMF